MQEARSAMEAGFDNLVTERGKLRNQQQK